MKGKSCKPVSTKEYNNYVEEAGINLVAWIKGTSQSAMRLTFTATQPQPRDGLIHPKYVETKTPVIASIGSYKKSVSKAISLELKREHGVS